MDVASYYRNGLVLPLAIPIVGGLLALALSSASQFVWLQPVAVVAVVFAFTGAVSCIPYVLFLAIMWRYFRLSTVAEYRRLAKIGPILIAIPFGLLAALTTGVLDEWSKAPTMFAYLGACALVVGYFHAGLIVAVAETTAAVGRRRAAMNPDPGRDTA